MILSLPSRGAWIEMTIGSALSSGLGVAPLAGSVDRNIERVDYEMHKVVAPLAGSVDRNHHRQQRLGAHRVAPLAGSVDRNSVPGRNGVLHYVAPLAGSVDRNTAFALPASGLGESLPSRGAWIEILSVTGGGHLLKSLPSRGAWIEII